MQVKLLRVLQDLEFEQVGGTKTFKIDTRVILATNEDLGRAVAEGRFRQDLFYRINVINIELPPLRERISDIPLLAEHFLEQVCEDAGKNGPRLQRRRHGRPAALPLAGQRPRAAERDRAGGAAWARASMIGLDDLPASLIAAGPVRVEPVGSRTLKQALEAPSGRSSSKCSRPTNWNRHATAEALGINRTTLYKKMKRLGLEEPQVAMGR